MKHPQNRQERRNVRNSYIAYRKKVLLRLRYNWLPTLENPPHEGEGRTYDEYLKYLEWQKLSEDDLKVLEVLAALEGHGLEKPWWRPTVWGRYAKFNMRCGCKGCSWCRNEQFEKALERIIRKEMEEEVA